MVRVRSAVILAAALAALACSGVRREEAARPARAESRDREAHAEAPTQAQAVAKAPEKVASIEGITEYRLANGLRVLCFPDPSKDTLTINVTYFVGSRHEGYGQAGMAHLLEHMLFKGTPTRTDVKQLIEQRGGTYNGSTSYDRTNFFEQLPASDENLQFVVELEADRMVHSKIDAQDLASEFSVVRNEFELGESDPEGVLEERLMSTAFLWHNYGKSPIGSKSDIERVPVESLRAFYRKYYQPDNAMVVLAGRFDEAQALARVDREFGAIARPERVLAGTYTIEPVQDGERSVVLRRGGDVALVGLVYHTVPGAHDDSLPLEAAVNLLADEPSGRLYQGLVASGLARRVSAGLDALAEPGVAIFFAEVDAKKPLEPVRDRMIQIVEGLSAPTAQEVARYVNRKKKDADLVLTQSDALAILLSEYAAMGDWRLFFVLRDRLDSLRPDAVLGAAQRYFRASNRTAGLFVPTAHPDRAPLPAQPDIGALVNGYHGRAKASEGEAFDPTVGNIEKHTERFSLASGMKVALLPKETRGDAVQAALLIHYGSEADLKGKTTAAELVAPMLMRGTRKRSYQQLRDALDALKADVNLGAESRPGSAALSITTVREHLPAALELVAEMLTEPAFPAPELEIVRADLRTARESQLQDPSAQAFNAAVRALLPFAPGDVRYRPTTAESIERLKAVQLADVQDVYERCWGGSHAELAIVGDFDAAAVKQVLEARYAGWKSPRPFERIATSYRDVAAVSRSIDTPDKEMAFVVAGHPLQVRDDSPDYPALELAGYILGGGSSSRLWKRLREKEGWSYGAFGDVHVESLDDLGYLLIGARSAPQNAAKVREAIVEEVQRFLAEGVSAAELDEAKKALVEQSRLELNYDDVLAGKLAADLYVGRTLAFDGQLLARIQALTPAEVNASAKKYLAPANLLQFLAGDLKKVGAP